MARTPIQELRPPRLLPSRTRPRGTLMREIQWFKALLTVRNWGQALFEPAVGVGLCLDEFRGEDREYDATR